ncbi:MAG: mannose-1-phosphate guanylyltransferase [Planctomycetota bacterium]
MRYAVIIAGGSGTRLWPMSRAALPKQLIPLFAGRSLLQLAIERLEGLVEPSRVLVCTGEKYRSVIRERLPQIADEQILGEPEGRDTLAAVGLPVAIAATRDAEASIAIFTADHLIEPIDRFQDRVHVGYEVAERVAGALVTFGIAPTYPATGYGYVERGAPLEGFDHAYTAERFVEKPDAATAERYLQSGRYAWNSGMFVWRAATLLAAIEKYKPQVHAGLMHIAADWDGPKRRSTLAEVFPTLEKVSIDFAVMEPASTDPAFRVAMVDMPLSWLDVGGWPAFAETLKPDAAGNRVATEATLLLDSRDNLIISSQPEHLVATIGIENLVVIHTPDATLICHRDQTERIKHLHREIGERLGERYL